MKIIYKYSPKNLTIISFRILICIGMLLTIIRWVSVFNNNILVFTKEINSHISNLSLSMILYLGIGYLWLLFGVKFSVIIILGTLLIIANIICETLLGFINTPDIVDAIYGIIGITIAFIFLFLTKKYGLIQNEY
ncbi:MAG: hypothetical protein FWD47_08775 [Treponema sp.]|nr:hypothetical protein [Treponema sp.]